MQAINSEASEGDVESQVVLPLLTRPELLGIASQDIRSKNGISARNIGKGTKRKVGYIPDFCVYKKALPVLIIEAKSPSGDVAQAYSEARLYALEINRSFPENCNPCCRVISTNGVHLLAGSWDSEPIISVIVEDLVPGKAALDDLKAFLGDEALQRLVLPISVSLRATDFARPFNHGAGPTQLDSHIEPNSFAADLNPALRRYFASRDQNTDEEIFSRAYISSNEITGYDRILESYLKDRLSRSKHRTEITTSRRRSDAITKTISSFDSKKTNHWKPAISHWWSWRRKITICASV